MLIPFSGLAQDTVGIYSPSHKYIKDVHINDVGKVLDTIRYNKVYLMRKALDGSKIYCSRRKTELKGISI